MLKPKFNLRNNPAYKEGSILGSTDVGTKIAPVPLTFTRASKGYVEKASGLTEMSSSLPRIDKDGRILFEPQRTNLLTWSQDFSNAAWIKQNGGTGIAPVVTPNAGLAPDGTMTADRVVFDASAASGDRSILRQPIAALTTEGVHSYYVKSNTGTKQYLSGQTSVGLFPIEATTEWSRVTFNSSIGAVYSGLEVRNGTTSSNYADVLIWQGQLEDVDSYPTSPIKTEGSTVTRVADDSGTTFSSPFNTSNGGTFVIELGGQETPPEGNTSPFIRFQLDSSNYIGVTHNGNLWRLRLQTTTNGAILNSSPISVTDRVILGASWNSNGWSMSANGNVFSSGNEDVSDLSAILDLITIMAEVRGVFRVGNMQIYESRLTDTELNKLTTL